MFGQKTGNDTQKIGFLLLPEFSLIAFTSAIEPLRAANRISRKCLYEWETMSLSGAPIEASNGVRITVEKTLTNAKGFDVIFVCAGTRPRQQITQELKDVIRKLARNGTPLGAVCTGSIALASAGVLSGHRCTIHWENIDGFKEEFPQLDIMATLFEIDRDRYTCSGGTAPLDMMIHCVRLDHGDVLARNVAEQLLHNTVRQADDSQRMTIEYRTGISHPKLLMAIGLMEASIENPLPLDRIAEKIDFSLRQIERLFKDHLSITPERYYLELRLKRARQYLRQTSMTIVDVSVATGFGSAAHFSNRYKAHYGHTPRQERA